jgi:hypothetical protein
MYYPYKYVENVHELGGGKDEREVKNSNHITMKEGKIHLWFIYMVNIRV